jgi:prevent-host-death family protein
MNVNIADLKDHLSHFLALVEQGGEVAICKRNIPIARIVPVAARHENRTVLGSDPGSVAVRGDLTEPAMPESDWGMLEVAEP